MNWLFHYTGLNNAQPASDANRLDYSYVLGNSQPAVRHDPHVHTQNAVSPGALRDISQLIRRTPADSE